jgi:hypothetical protein
MQNAHCDCKEDGNTGGVDLAMLKTGRQTHNVQDVVIFATAIDVCLL